MIFPEACLFRFRASSYEQPVAARGSKVGQRIPVQGRLAFSRPKMLQRVDGNSYAAGKHNSSTKCQESGTVGGALVLARMQYNVEEAWRKGG